MGQSQSANNLTQLQHMHASSTRDPASMALFSIDEGTNEAEPVMRRSKRRSSLRHQRKDSVTSSTVATCWSDTSAFDSASFSHTDATTTSLSSSCSSPVLHARPLRRSYASTNSCNSPRRVGPPRRPSGASSSSVAPTTTSSKRRTSSSSNMKRMGRKSSSSPALHRSKSKQSHSSKGSLSKHLGASSLSLAHKHKNYNLNMADDNSSWSELDTSMLNATWPTTRRSSKDHSHSSTSTRRKRRSGSSVTSVCRNCGSVTTASQ